MSRVREYLRANLMVLEQRAPRDAVLEARVMETAQLQAVAGAAERRGNC